MKTFKLLFTIGIIVAIIFWGSITFFIGSAVKEIKEDKRPFFEQVGSGLKDIGEDFNRGLESDTTIVLNTDTIE